MVVGQKGIRMPCCCNSFHAWCCLRWLGKESCRCPVCRQPLPEIAPPASSSEATSANTSSGGSSSAEGRAFSPAPCDPAVPGAVSTLEQPCSPLTSHSVADLKRLCHIRGLDPSHCLEKKDLLALLNASPSAAATAQVEVGEVDRNGSGAWETPSRQAAAAGLRGDAISGITEERGATEAAASSSQHHIATVEPVRRHRGSDDDFPGGKLKKRR